MAGGGGHNKIRKTSGYFNFTDCIGFVRRSEFHISSPSWFSSALMDLGRSTWLMPYSQSPEFQVDNACGHRQPRHWLYR